jgi:hypothetical protein
MHLYFHIQAKHKAKAHALAVVCRQANQIKKEWYEGNTDLDTKPTDPGL